MMNSSSSGIGLAGEAIPRPQTPRRKGTSPLYLRGHAGFEIAARPPGDDPNLRRDVKSRRFRIIVPSFFYHVVEMTAVFTVRALEISDRYGNLARDGRKVPKLAAKRAQK